MSIIIPDSIARRIVSNRRVNLPLFAINTDVRIKTQIVCARSGRVVKDNPFRRNLVLDAGLNGLAQKLTGNQCGPASMALTCAVGSGNTPVKIASGAVTFTQVGTTLTASSGFFAANMVGGIFKYGASGSGGAEYYITAFTSTTVVTVDTSATVGTPTAGVVWQVQQTTLSTPLFTTSTYQLLTGDCLSTIAGNVMTHQRTFVFPVQGSSYNVNEIGYGPVTSGICGRIVLPSTDVVGTSNFYRVIIQVVCTYSPGAPTAVGNIGVNFNTAGNAMIEYWSVSSVNPTNGTSDPNISPTAALMAGLDAASKYSGYAGSTSQMFLIARIGATYTQNASISTGLGLSWGTLGTNYLTPAGSAISWSNNAAVRGQMKLAYAGNTTTTGQTCYGIGISPTLATVGTNKGNPAFDILFTTPQALPNGAWLPNIEFSQTYGRTLVN
jgi:hypothetical protein